MAIREIYELDGLDSEGFVTVGHTRRDQNFPGLEAAGKNCIDGAERPGVAAQVVEKDLHHAGEGRPKIGLLGVIMNRLDGAGISERQRNLDLALAAGKHFCGEAFAEAGELTKKAAVVWVDLQRFNPYSFDQVGRIGFGNDFAKCFLGAARDSHFDAIARSERNDIGWKSLP